MFVAFEGSPQLVFEEGELSFDLVIEHPICPSFLVNLQTQLLGHHLRLLV